MDWHWLDRQVGEDVVIGLLTDSARVDLAAAGLPAPMLDLLAPQQARARLAGHVQSHPQARASVLADPDDPSGDGVGGRALVDRSTGEWVLVDLVVAPGLRGRGAGTWMLHQVTTAADEAGHPVVLQVRRGSPAQRLYERAGFVAVGGDDLDLRMRRAGGRRRGDSVSPSP